ncbi:MAG: hypothetical protein L3J04_03785 [Robiginitomaculum sp.]|nr:hypothetical protein [Robiginitomaculum sp.]
MARQNKQPGFFVAFFSFKRMVSPFLLGIIYFLGFAAIIVTTGYKLYQGPEPHIFLMMLPIDLAPIMIKIIAYAGTVLSGLFLIVLWRFLIELTIVMFAIYNELGLVLEMLNAPSTPQPSNTAIPMPAPITTPPPQEVAEPEIQPLPETTSQVTEVENPEADDVEKEVAVPVKDEASSQETAQAEPTVETEIKDKIENTGDGSTEDEPPPPAPTSGADLNAPSRRRRR